MTVSQHRPTRGHALSQYRPQVVTVGDAPLIDWRASRVRALDRPGCPVCADCGCVLDETPLCHAPRCGAA